MAADATQTHVWEGAAVFVAPIGTTAPTDLETDWPAGWDDVGFIAEDGITRGVEHDTDRHFGLHLDGSQLVKTSKRNFVPFFSFMPLEDNPVVFSILNPGSTPDDAAGILTRALTLPKYTERAWGIEQVQGDTVRRFVFPRGLVAEQGDIEESPEGLSSFELRIDLLATDGVYGTNISEGTPA